MESGQGEFLPGRQRLGFSIGVAAGAALALGLYLLARSLHPDSGLILGSVLLIPPAASALAVLVSGIKGEGALGAAAKISLTVVATLLVGSGLVFHEGI